MMKKIISLFFLLLILFQSGGMIWWFKANQISIQLRMNERLNNPNSDFEKLTISYQAYLENSIDEGREIKWNGKLYDVKSASFKKNRVQLLVLNDCAETNLLQQFAQFIKHTSDAQKQIPEYVSQFLVVTYLIPTNELILHQTEKIRTSFCFQSFASKTYQFQISTPPPKLFS